MPTAILLFSEGLDSTLVGLILKREGLKVIALRFITPFFGWKYKRNPQLFEEKVKNLGLDSALLIDLTEKYLEILKNPKFGYGDYANPCMDCKILFFKEAKNYLEKLGADFIATGEVLGQRPMSQSKVALERIEKLAGVEGILLRPLSAKLLKETEPEKRGIIKRENLYVHSGRCRTFQFQLAYEFGLKEIPTPGGGCLLTDPIIGKRVLRVLREKRPLTLLTAELLTFGRHFLEDSLWLALGRNQEENQRLVELSKDQFPLYTLSEPSPYLAVLQGNLKISQIKEILINYSKKAQKKLVEGGEIEVLSF